MGSRKPNILWIVTTQWRAQAFGHAGDPNARTPRLDVLAAESVDFTQAVTPHPGGPFARAALLTGLASPENGVRGYYDPLPADARTIAHELNDRGYATAFFGKWHLWKRDPAAPPVGGAHAKIIVPAKARGGFGFWEGFESGFLLNNPWLHGTGRPEPEQFSGYQSDVICSRAAAWLEAAGAAGGPWFCVVSLEAPHPPYDAPAAGVAAHAPEEIILPANVPRGGAAEAKARRELAGYYAHIEATDRAAGRLLAGVARKNTAVVFTSAHGDMHGAHGLFRKGWPHEESVRVPLLVRHPAARAGRDDATVSLADLPAMALAWADGGAWGGPSGPARISMPAVMPFPQQCDRVWRGLRTKARKLALNADGTPWLFFDLENDPLEMRNLADDPAHARELAELRAAADQSEA